MLRRRVISLAVLLLATLTGGAAFAVEATSRPGTRIRKIAFLFHPVCWAHGMRGTEPPPGTDPKLYLACFEREKQVNQRQKQYISRMKPDEALVVFPIGRSPAMLDLEQHAEKVLGPRCIIVRRNSVDPPAAWSTVPHAMQRFLTDQSLEGRSEFLKNVSPEIQAELAAEISQAGELRGYDWNLAVLEVIYYSRLCAQDVLNAFGERGLTFDPQTMQCEAFGEGFEQCAMTWKQMLVPYMGLAAPAYNVFDLSVSGAPFLLKARPKERVQLDHEIQLFLWEGADGRPIGLFARAWCRLKDPQFYARIPLQGAAIGVWDLTSRIKPSASSPVRQESDDLIVPVLNAIRRDSTDLTGYVIGSGVRMPEFRERLIRAKLVEK